MPAAAAAPKTKQFKPILERKCRLLRRMWLTGNETKQAKCDKSFLCPCHLFMAQLRDRLSEVHRKTNNWAGSLTWLAFVFFEPLKLAFERSRPSFVGRCNQQNVRPMANSQLTNSQQTAAPIAGMTLKSNYKML